MADKIYTVKESELTSIAQSIRNKTSSTDQLIFPTGFVEKIDGIQVASTDVPFIFGGKNAIQVGEFEDSWTLADTSFVIGESASTSTTVIKAAVSNKYVTPTYAFGNSDIVVVQNLWARPHYTEEAVNKAKQINYIYTHVYHFSKRKSSPTATSQTVRQGSAMGFNLITYYTSAGALTKNSASYGFYISAQTPTVASTTATSTTVRIGEPSISYRASSTYLSTTNIKLVDECDFHFDAKVYAVDQDSTLESVLINQVETLYDEIAT